MDDGERLASLEATVKAHADQFVYLKSEFSRIHDVLASLRDHSDQQIKDLRDHTDQQIRDLRDHTDRGLEGVRQEQIRTIRWLIGFGLTYGAFLLGIATKVF